MAEAELNNVFWERVEFIHHVLKKEPKEEEEKKKTMDTEGGELIQRRAVSLFCARTDKLID